MDQYNEFMDGVQVSDTLHQRLLGLEAPGRPAAWKRYGAMAAALALVCGLAGWGLARSWNRLQANFRPDAELWEDIADRPLVQPDIALLGPGDVIQPEENTAAGYEVRGEGDGPNTEVTYYILPRIIYGDTGGAVAALDWDVPKGAVKKDLAQAEIMALLGGEDAVRTHLDWAGYELTGWAAWNEDGSFWGAYVYGRAGELERFEFAVTADQLPPTCIAFPESLEQEVFLGVTVTADGHDYAAGPEGGRDASTRRVSFMVRGCGYRFDLTGADRALTEERVSRLVRLAVNGGITPDAVGADGAAPAHPWEAG